MVKTFGLFFFWKDLLSRSKIYFKQYSEQNISELKEEQTAIVDHLKDEIKQHLLTINEKESEEMRMISDLKGRRIDIFDIH